MEGDRDAGRPDGHTTPPSERYPPPGQRFSSKSLLQRWQAVLLHPSVAAFDAQQPTASWRTILISLLIQGAVGAVTGFVRGLEPHAPVAHSLPSANAMLLLTTPVGGAVYGLLESTIGFFAFSGVMFASAKLFHGKGTFLTQSWLLSLFYVPLGILIVVTDLIPVVGAMLGVAVALYEFVLTVLATISAHRVQRDIGIAIALFPTVALIAIVCALLAVVAFVLTNR